MVFLRHDTKKKSDESKNKLNFIKSENVCVSKDTIKKVKTHRITENICKPDI